MSLIPGRNFGHYEILRLLGRGGMGEVYLARDKTLKRFVAIKIVSPQLIENTDQVRRFQKEASFAAALNHPNICTIHETGEIDGLTYICMEYVEGDTLRHYVSSREVSIQEVLDIAIQIADALDEAHKKNVIHRDIKTSNVLLTPRKFVKILDFGLAKQLPRFKGEHLSDTSTDSLLTGPGNPIRGTTAYMAPEVILGKQVDNRSDIFSFGVVLYEMLTGRLPFTGNSAAEMMDEILHKDATAVTRYNDKVPDALIHILKKMLEKDPENRYQSVHEVWIDLRRLRDESFRTGTLTPTQVDHVRSGSQRKWILPVVIAFAFAILIPAVLYLTKHRSSQVVKTQTSAEKPKAIAVLPFKYTGDSEHKYFGALVTDALIAGLESEPGLAIAPFATVRDLNEKASIQEIARELGVDWIVRGDVSGNESELHINSEMLDSDANTIWSQPLTGSADRLVSALEKTKNSLLAELRLATTNAKPIDHLRTPNMDAYEYYVRARVDQEDWDKGGNLDQAIEFYKKAMEIDPDFAAAHAGLAQALLTQYRKLRTPSLLVEASAEAKKAVSQDSSLPESLISNGLVQLETGNTVEARVAFADALKFAPGNDAACRNIAAANAALGRYDDAKQMYEQAIALRPNYWWNYYTAGRFLFGIANFDEAKVHLLKASELHPDGAAPLVLLGLIDLTNGNLVAAEAFFRKALEHGPDINAQSNLSLVYYYRGKYDLAVRSIQASLQQAPDDPLFHANLADTYRAMGEQDKARTEYLVAIDLFRSAIAANPKDFERRSGIAMALSAIGRCDEAKEEARNVLAQQSKSQELAPYAAVTATRCGDLKWATQIVLDAIAMKNVLDIRFHPELEVIRQIPEVKRALATVDQKVKE